jgi:iron complex outermembrane receptor protein
MPQQFHGGIEYNFKLGNGGMLTPRIDVTYLGPLAGADLAPAPGSPSATYGQIGGYTLADARLTWRNSRGDLDVALSAMNITNKYYFYSKFDLTGAGAGTISGSPGQPLTFALTIRKTFASQ